MSSIQEILAMVTDLQGLSDDLSSKQTSSHDAIGNVTLVTTIEQAKIDAATAGFDVAVGEARADADAAVRDTADATNALDDKIAQIQAALQALAVPRTT